MRPIKLTSRGLTLGLAVTLALLSPLAASAQSQLDVADAQAFMGSWVIDIESDFGPFSMNLEITDEAGKVAASIGAPEMGGMQSVTDVSREGDDLVMVWEMDAQGQFVNAMMRLAPDGENLTAALDVADGQFMADGVATKAAS